jgi:putative transposase
VKLVVVRCPGLPCRKGAHSSSEIAAKLTKAAELPSQAKPQTEVARMLGVSVITLHRWPKRRTRADANSRRTERHAIMELEVENARLRQVAVDLVLEKDEAGSPANEENGA